MVYTLPIPCHYSHLHITQLEMLNVVVALKVWASVWADKIIDIKCDNLAVVEVLTSGKTKDNFLATCARNVWLICAIFNIQIRVWHIPGKSNHIADLLSSGQLSKIHCINFRNSYHNSYGCIHMQTCSNLTMTFNLCFRFND